MESLQHFLQQNLIWVALAVFSGGWLLFETVRQARDKSLLSPLEATLLINREDAEVVDVRALGDFEKGHLPNSRSLPLVDFDRRIGELDKFRDKPLIFYCDNGSSAAKAIAAVKKAGFEKLYSLRGGLYEWEKAGQPVTRAKPKSKK
ncbi:MAG: rhodanese-like domain-containing protein [Azoarcus sp.]|nr:rhodanese-like domain-containing protein [Azoarcus sp.]